MVEKEKIPRHNHLTRDIKAWGKCPGCDWHHLLELGATTLVNEIKNLSAQVAEYEHALEEVARCGSCVSCTDMANGALQGVNREDFNGD